MQSGGDCFQIQKPKPCCLIVTTTKKDVSRRKGKKGGQELFLQNWLIEMLRGKE